MAIPLTVSETPLVFDTLAAVKVCHYYGSPAPHIYTMARAYIYKGGLSLSLAAFERDPAPESRVAVAVAGGPGADTFLLLTLGPSHVSLALCSGAGQGLWRPTGHALAAPSVQRLAGVDEQGWYWGGTTAIAPDALAQAGIMAAVGATLSIGLFKLNAGGAAYGASFRPQDPADPLRPADFPAFDAVPY